jgi:hypothetical protein
MPGANNRLAKRSCATVFATLLPSILAAQVTLFPKVRSFEYPIGSPYASGVVGRLLSVTRGETQYGAEREAEAAIGESVPVLGLASGRVPVHLDLGVRVTGRFSLDDPRSALISDDWFVGVQSVVDFPRARLALELYHESSHLGDEYAERFGATRLDWTREVAALWLEIGGGPFRGHASGSYALVERPDVSRAAATLGFDYRGRAGHWLGAEVMPVLGVFAESVAYADWKVTTSARAGLELGHGNDRVGLSLVFSNGLSTERQFYDQRSRYVGAELRFEF